MTSDVALNGNDPFDDAQPVTLADDVTDLPGGICRSIWVGAAGNVNLITRNGQTRLIPNVPVGVLPIRASRILKTSTTASSLMALY